jgi:hypothetical protein
MSIHTKPQAPIGNQPPGRIALQAAHAEVAKTQRDLVRADAVAAFCAMKGVARVEGGRDDQAAVKLLEELGSGLARKVVRRFKPEIHIYPSHDTILEILSEMENDGSLGPDVDSLD